MGVEGIHTRLRLAIAEWRDGSINAFHRELHSAGVQGSSYTQIHKYLRGETVPPLEFVVAAAGVLGARIEWLANGTGARPTTDFEDESTYQAVYDLIHGSLADALPGYDGPMDRLAVDAVQGLVEQYLEVIYPHLETIAEHDPAERDDYVGHLCDELAGVFSAPLRILPPGIPTPQGELLNQYVTHMAVALQLFAIPAHRRTPYGEVPAAEEGDTDGGSDGANGNGRE